MSTPQYLEFILTQKFDRMTRDWMDDATLQALQATLIEQPETGAVVAGTGGVRKVRVALPGRGKSGSARVIYLYRATQGRIYLLLGYQKNVQTSLTTAEKEALKHWVRVLAEEA